MRTKLFVIAFLYLPLVLGATVFSYGNPERSDQETQITLGDAFAADAVGLQQTKEALRLAPTIDVTSAFGDGTLAAKVEALPPLRAEHETSNGRVAVSPKAYIATATLWTSTTENVIATPDGILRIPVCWQNPSADTAHGQAITKQAVAATWEFYGMVRFVWSDKCTSDTKGIKIFVEDGRPWSYYGVQSQFPGQSMSLNFTFDNPQMNGCKAIADLCIWSIAVHEFGHALGFIHEQDSPDLPLWCRKRLNPADIQKAEDTLKAKMLTDWDQYSVMDYCFDIYKSRVQLSDCDIAAYRQMYGTPPNPTYKPACHVKG